MSLMELIASSGGHESAPVRAMCPDCELSLRTRPPPGKGRQLFLLSPRTFNLTSEMGQASFQRVLWRTDRFARGLEGGLLGEDDAGQAMRSQLVLNDGPKQMSFHRVGANARTEDGRRIDEAAGGDAGAIWGPPVHAGIRHEIPEPPERCRKAP